MLFGWQNVGSACKIKEVAYIEEVAYLDRLR